MSATDNLNKEDTYAIFIFQTTEAFVYTSICNESYLSKNPIFLNIYCSTQASFMVCSLILNATIIGAVCINKRLQTVPHVFIASLAVSDIITSCIFGISELIIFTDIEYCLLPNSFKCTRSFFISFGIISNLINHFIISIERWLYIARPFLHQRIVTRRSTVFSLITVWIIAGLTNINMVTEDCELSVSKSVNVGIVSPALHFLLSLVMIFIYTHIACLTRRAVRNINKTRPMGMSNEVQCVNKPMKSLKSNLKNTRMLVTVFGIFFIALTPVVFADIYAYSGSGDFYATIAGKIFDIAWSSHCCLNFFIYAVQDRAFMSFLKECRNKFVLCALRFCQVQGDAATATVQAGRTTSSETYAN